MPVFYENCPLCEGNVFNAGPKGDAKKHGGFSTDLKVTTLNWLTCLWCGHEFTESYWTLEELDILFRATRQDQLPLGNPWKGRTDSAQMIERLNNPWIGNWLDIGAGSGVLMLTAQEYGYKVFGTEIRKHTRKALQAIGLAVTEKIPVQKYHVISACDVLEHMPFPREELMHWRVFAEPGTKLLISCPNLGAPMWKLLEDNPYYYELEHHHNFSYRRLSDLLYETGWTKIRYGVSHRYLLGMELIAEAA